MVLEFWDGGEAILEREEKSEGALGLLPGRGPNPIPRPRPLLTSMSDGADPFSFTSRLFRAVSRSSNPRSPEVGSPTSPLRVSLLMWY